MISSIFEKLRFSHKKSLNLVMQSEASECALACLTMLANYHGNGISIDKLRQASPSSSQGSDLNTLIQEAAQLGLSSRALKADIADLSELELPAILHWNFNHFVVLTKVGKHYFDIADPAIGMRRVAFKELNTAYTGIALELRVNSRFTKTKSNTTRTLKLTDFFKNTRNVQQHLWLLFALSLLLQLFAVAAPFYMQTVIDEVIVNTNNNLLVVLALAFSALLCIDVLTSFIRDRVMLRFSNYLNLHMASSVFHHLIHLPVNYFQKRHLGDIVSRFGALKQIRDIISSGIVTALIDGLMAIVMLIVLLIYSVPLAMIVSAVLCLYIILRLVFFGPMKRQQTEVIQSSANESSHFMQSIRAIKTLKLNNNIAQRQSQWTNFLTTAMNKQIRLASWNINFATLNKGLFGLENILIVFLAAHLVLDSLFSIGMLYAFMNYKSRFISAASSLVNTWLEFKMLSVHLARLADILYSIPESPSTLTEAIAGAISTSAANDNYHSNESHSCDVIMAVIGLSYRYHSALPFVFNEVSFEVKRSQTIAIVGQSGSGKTTLLQCLLGLIEPNEGRIDVLSPSGTMQSLKAQNRHLQGFAAVLQDDQLLTGSILDNVSDFAEKVDINRVIEACISACIHQDILQMKMQYNSLIGDMGSSVSGGQKQRILLARALYKKPKILFLDEATSHLDVTNEKQINQNLSRLKITKIVIAHRPETIESADVVLSLHQGKLNNLREVQAPITTRNVSSK